MSGVSQDDPNQQNNQSIFTDTPGLSGNKLPAAVSDPMHAVPYRVLARKYRPITFDDLIGQETMVRTVRNAFAVGRVAHAFMLTGVRGVGKTTTARIVARAVNCTGPDGTGGPTADPCGICSNCIGILADRHPDVIEMDAASRTGVDDMREVIDATRFRPMQARTKVFVIDEVHMLSRNAFNALLKTLEEPPPHVKFIFATTEIRKVPITVLSRCQRFDLRRVSVEELARHFSNIAAKEGALIELAAVEQIARSADGSVRDGLSILDQAIALADGPITIGHISDMLGLADHEAVFQLVDAVVGGKPATALAISDRAYEHGADLGTLLQDMLGLFHTVARIKSIPDLRESLELPEAERVRGANLADRLSIPVLARLWQMLLKGVGEVETAPDRRAAAEMVLIRLCHVADIPTPGDLIRRLNAGVPAIPVHGSGGGGSPARAVANGSSVISNHPMPKARPYLSSFREVVAFVGELNEVTLHAHLLHSVHLVNFAPPVIELRPQSEAPRDLAPRLAALLSKETGTRWTIAVSAAIGEPTIAEQGGAAKIARKMVVADHPLVHAILMAFPGAYIDTVHDKSVDAYGLPAPTLMSLNFIQPEPEYYDDETLEIDL